MMRFFQSFTLACLAILLAACAMNEAQEIKRPVIARAPVFHDVHYPPRNTALSDAEQQHILRFLRDDLAAQKDVTLSAATPESPWDTRRIAALRGLLTQHGYAVLNVVETSALPRDRIRISGQAVTAHAPESCPDWKDAGIANYRNTVMRNFGCAHAHNLSRMVEDPSDLAEGKGNPTTDATRSSEVIRIYRQPPPAPQTVGGASQTGGL